MRIDVGDLVIVTPPTETKSRARESWRGTVIDTGETVGIYNIMFSDGSTD